MRALVTRPRENAGSIAKILAERDIEVLLEPLLDIRPTEHEPIELGGIQAILVTSPAGARALADAVSRRDVPVYAVGDATADLLKETGFEKVESARGDSEALAALVSERLNPKEGTLLYASGRTVAGDLTEKLNTSGFEVQRVELYAARPAAALSDVTVSALREGRLDIALFFSPRTAQTFTRLVKEADLADKCASVRAFCLSQTVADSVASVTWAGVEVAEKPEQMALVDRIDAYVASQTEKPAEEEAATPRKDAGTPPPAAAVPPPQRPSRAPAYVAIGLAVIAIIAVLLMWRNQQDLTTRMAEANAPTTQAVADLRQRVEDINATLGGLEARVQQAPAADTSGIESRLSDVEAAAESRTSAAESRIEALSDSIAGVQESIESLRSDTSARLDEIAGAAVQPADLEALTGELSDLSTRLDREMAAVRERLEGLGSDVAAAQKAADEAAGRTTAAAMLALGKIQAAVEAGRPFAEPLSQLRRLVDDLPGADETLAGWVDHAQAGIPTRAALDRQFEGLLVEAGRQVEAGDGPAWLNEAMERAASIVSIRRVGEDVEGDSTDAILARAEAALDRDDLAAAVAELENLNGNAADLFAGWISDARARIAAAEGLIELENLVIANAGGRG